MGRKKKELIPVTPIEPDTFYQKLDYLRSQGRSITDLERICNYVNRKQEFELWRQSRETMKETQEIS